MHDSGEMCMLVCICSVCVLQADKLNLYAFGKIQNNGNSVHKSSPTQKKSIKGTK